MRLRVLTTGPIFAPTSEDHGHFLPLHGLLVQMCRFVSHAMLLFFRPRPYCLFVRVDGIGGNLA